MISLSTQLFIEIEFNSSKHIYTIEFNDNTEFLLPLHIVGHLSAKNAKFAKSAKSAKFSV